MTCIKSNAGLYAVSGGCTFKPGICCYIFGWSYKLKPVSIRFFGPILTLQDRKREEGDGRQLWVVSRLLSRKMDQVGVFVRSYMTRRVASCDQGQVFGELLAPPGKPFLGDFLNSLEKTGIAIFQGLVSINSSQPKGIGFG